MTSISPFSLINSACMFLRSFSELDIYRSLASTNYFSICSYFYLSWCKLRWMKRDNDFHRSLLFCNLSFSFCKVYLDAFTSSIDSPASLIFIWLLSRTCLNLTSYSCLIVFSLACYCFFSCSSYFCATYRSLIAWNAAASAFCWFHLTYKPYSISFFWLVTVVLHACSSSLSFIRYATSDLRSSKVALLSLSRTCSFRFSSVNFKALIWAFFRLSFVADNL